METPFCLKPLRESFDLSSISPAVRPSLPTKYSLTTFIPLLHLVWRHPGLRDQLERAALPSLTTSPKALNAGTTNELLVFLYIACGSAGEVRSIMRVLETWSIFSHFKSQISDFIQRCEKISKQLYGWIEGLKNSEIPGQRRLDDKAKNRYASRKERDQFLEELNRISAKPQPKPWF
jgi:four helix bundle protein